MKLRFYNPEIESRKLSSKSSNGMFINWTNPKNSIICIDLARKPRNMPHKPAKMTVPIAVNIIALTITFKVFLKLKSKEKSVFNGINIPVILA